MDSPATLLEYHGQKVLTTTQISTLFGCSRRTISSIFYCNKEFFDEGTDYFYLTGGELRTFKKKSASQKFAALATPGSQNSAAPISPLASTLYLWTESGALKLSKFVGTDEGKIIYTNLALGYFKPEPPANIEQLDRLERLIDKCKDETLRDNLIREAAKIILGKEF